MDEWNENRSLEWELLQYPVHKEMQEYVKALNHLYTTQPALYEMDYEPEGFEWINCTYNDENIAIFIRKTKRPGTPCSLSATLFPWLMRNSGWACPLPENIKRS